MRQVHEEVLDCGYKKCCPTVKKFEDGSFLITDDDAAIGSVGTIKLTAEAADRLAEIIKASKQD